MFLTTLFLQTVVPVALGPQGAISLLRQISRSWGGVGVFSNTSLPSAVYCYNLIKYLRHIKLIHLYYTVCKLSDFVVFPPSEFRVVCEPIIWVLYMIWQWYRSDSGGTLAV